MRPLTKRPSIILKIVGFIVIVLSAMFILQLWTEGKGTKSVLQYLQLWYVVPNGRTLVPFVVLPSGSGHINFQFNLVSRIVAQSCLFLSLSLCLQKTKKFLSSLQPLLLPCFENPLYNAHWGQGLFDIIVYNFLFPQIIIA